MFILSLEKKQAIKTNDKSNDTFAKTHKTVVTQSKIIDYLKENGRSNCAEIAKYIGLSPERTRAILSSMKEIEPLGENRNRTYRIK